MNNGFWSDLKKPIVGLAPMDGITDPAMRFISKKYGKPEVIYTEFVAVEGLVRKAKSLFNDLKFDKSERPIVAQLFGIDPAAFREAAKIIVDLGFDGVDINMGCPAKSVVGRGSGAGLIKNYPLVKEIVEAVKDGVEEKIPVSVKTRMGYESIDFDWMKRLADLGLAAIVVHGRTFRQGYGGQADWETLDKMAEIVRSSGSLFLGNGDVKGRISKDEFLISNGKRINVKEKFDGVLIGQAARGNPWIFKVEENGLKISFEERMRVAIEHAKKFEELNPKKSFLPMRKYLAWYFRDFSGAVELRKKLVLTNSSEEARLILEMFCDIK